MRPTVRSFFPDQRTHLEDVKADIPSLVYIRMEAECHKLHFRRLEGIIRREPKIQLVGESLVHSSDAALYGACPGENIVALWEGGNSRVAGHLYTKTECQLRVSLAKRVS